MSRQPIVIHYDRGKLVRRLVVLTLVAAMIALLLVARVGTGGIIIATPFWLFASTYFVYLLIFQPVVLIIDEVGITWGGPMIGMLLIRWEEMEHIRRVKPRPLRPGAPTSPYLEVVLAHPQEVLSRYCGLSRTLLRWSLQLSEGQRTTHLSSTLLPVSADQLLMLIQEFAPQGQCRIRVG